MEMRNKNPFKHRLTRYFRSSSLLKSSCNAYCSSSIIFTSSTNMGSTRILSSFTIDDTLLLVPSNSGSINSDSKLDRTLTSSSSSQMLSLSCNACRPTKALEDDVVAVVKKKKKKEEEEEEEEKMGRRINKNSEFYETGERYGKTCPHASPSSPSKNDFHFERTQEEKEIKNKKDVKKKKMMKKKFFSNAYGFSSSADNDDYDNDVENGPDHFFSSEEMGAFFSCRSFSSDSFEFYKSLRRKKEKKEKKNKNKKKDKRQRSRRTSEVYDGFKPIVSVIEREKSMDGIPVTKISRDPYVDFRDSMVEMIVERQIFGAKDLDKLLHSYLSLNSPLHHSVIIRAFAEISGVLRGY